MKLKKILSAAAASVLVAGVVATSASADWMPIDGKSDGLNIGTGNYLNTIFCNVETKDMPMTDYEIDLSKVASVSFTMTIPDDDDLESKLYFDGAFGGFVGASVHIKDHPQGDELYDAYNWTTQEFWGLIDTGAPDPNSYDVDGVYMDEMPTYINSFSDEKPLFIETLAPYTYRIKGDIKNPVAAGDCAVEDITDFRVFLSAWGGGGNPWSFYYVKVTRTVLFDADNNPLIAFDEKGNVVDTNDDDKKEPVKPVAPEEDIPPMPFPGSVEAPVESTPDSTPAEESSTPAESSTPESTPAESSTPESAPTSSTSTNDSNGLPVGAIVGIIAGVVVVIGVVVGIVIKKKKG